MPETLQGDLDQAIVERADELSAILRDTVRIPSVTGTEHEVAEWYAEWMRSRGWDVELQPLRDTSHAASEEIVGDRVNVIGYPLGRPATEGPLVALNGHIDVVPPGSPELWRGDPYSGASIDGRIHGRGSVDMKGGIAAALIALDTLRRTGASPALHPVLHLVIGEETTGVGTRLVLESGRPPLAAVILEPTNNTIVTACTGLQFFRVTAHGRAAHSSAPWRGIDALARLLRLRDALEATAAKRSAEFSHPRFADVPTGIPFTIGMLEAGAYRAAVPDRASLTGRLGLRPGEDPESARAEYLETLRIAVADDAHEAELPHEVEWQGEPYLGWDTSEHDPFARAFRDALVGAGGPAQPAGFTAGNDAGQYAQAGATTLVFGPGDAALAHTSEESIPEADVLLAARTVAAALAAITRPDLGEEHPHG